jgi:hypothetical protein
MAGEPFGELFAVRVDGTGLVRLTHNGFSKGTPDMGAGRDARTQGREVRKHRPGLVTAGALDEVRLAVAEQLPAAAGLDDTKGRVYFRRPGRGRDGHRQASKKHRQGPDGGKDARHGAYSRGKVGGGRAGGYLPLRTAT